MLLFKFLAVFQPPHGGRWMAPGWAAELDGVGGRHGVQTLLHLLCVGPVRRPCFGKGHWAVVRELRLRH